jgi:hypothetical protein
LLLILLALIIYNERKTKEFIKQTRKKFYNLGYTDGVKRMEKEFTKHIQELSK